MKRLAERAAWLLAAWPTTAVCAQEAVAPDPETVEVVAIPPSDQRELVQVPPWSVSAGAGVSVRENGPDMTWEAMTLTRQVGSGYVRGAVIRYHGAPFRAKSTSSAQYLVGTFGAGINREGWLADGWASVGRQDYGQVPLALRGAPGGVAEGSGYYSAGGDFGKILPLGGNWYLTPTVAGSYAHGKLLREVLLGPWSGLVETAEPAWSANATLRLDHAFGADRVHYAGIYLSQNWTSNGLSEILYPSGEERDRGAGPGIRRYADTWLEAGVAATFTVTSRLQMDLFASRSSGMLSGNTTSAGLTLRKTF